ncbi:MAG TPA: C25 family cysteine peptidase [Tepidisphaeraceae bacterium]|nr:C25 family cysteine peptidase [Tepidisphaeraceae bacterium]
MRNAIHVAVLIALLICSAARAADAPQPASPAGGKLLLVVAPEKFHEPLKEFLRFKEKFRPVQFASLEDVLRTSKGVDDPERLKQFIYDLWKSKSLGYLLLVGDRDIMPVRYMVLDRITPAAFDYAFYPSDLYYGDVARDDGSFDNWNAAADGFHAGYFGEVHGEKNKHDPINFDRIHYRCQVAVGRWPVSDEKHLAIVVAKSMKYEAGIRDGTHPGMRKLALFNVHGWVDARDRLAAMAAHGPVGWNTTELFFRDANDKFQTVPPDLAHVLEVMDNGAGFCAHVGHGSETSWAGGALGAGDVKRLHNADRLPIVFSAGCSTAYFAPLGPYEPYTDVDGKDHAGTDHGEVFTAPPPPPSPYQKRRIIEGLGKVLVIQSENGAAAYIGCNTGGQPCGVTLLEGLLDGLGDPKAWPEPNHPTIGDCWRHAIAYYYDKEHLATLKPNNDWYPPSIFFQGMKYMLFGDPTLPMAGK